jgi:hypothetical protein
MSQLTEITQFIFGQPLRRGNMNNMEIMIELTEAELDAIAGGSGTAAFSFTDTASGTSASVSGTLTIHTKAPSASLSGTFSSCST